MSTIRDGHAAPYEAEPRLTLRDERREDGSELHLEAYLDEDGNLHIDGQDLGPTTAPVSGDGEYEYFKTVAAADLPRVLRLLNADPGESILKVLKRSWTGDASYELEALLEKSDIPVALFTWSG